MGKYLSHPLVMCLAVIGVIIFSLSTKNTIQNYQKTSQTIDKIEAENKKLNQNIAELEQKKAYSQTQFAKERIIRNELLLQKPGEFVIQLPENLPAPPSPSPSPSPEPIEEWKHLLF